ncbi:hypothetical protein Mal4_57440 [Maioricimonas rarisocia]|uniref:Uncharacterized protein n=1 Tax=Maioricimonas rarisocia TaxID=2528026 RepID=A0A517ZFW8_9PLAN|nr:hypothetical protein [Maioricimonas rarisocia]QDU41377.1 hypothetical protein Mal4_57440 [Maioricimonas rarisocia]
MNRAHDNATVRRTGFTLVEMLVATGLTVLIMLLFASVFGTAVGTMTQQRGIANNDQKARTLQTVLRGDLEAMTYRQPSYSNVEGIVPFGPDDNVAGLVAPNQRGYFYYSENVPDLPDDVLQFTIDVMQDNARGDVVLTGRTGEVMAPVTTHINQPEMDDGIDDNGVGTSRAAEVCYFMRDGNLYRRVQLIREPQPNRNPPFDPQPRRSPAPGSGSAGTGARAFPPPSGFVSGDFLKEMDYSVAMRWIDSDGDNNLDAAGTSAGEDQYYLHFHSLDSLDNSKGLVNVPLAWPVTRFGHWLNGNPREYIEDTSGADVFLGRFTHAETSDDDFDWPGQFPSGVTGLPVDDPGVHVPVNPAYVIQRQTNGDLQGSDGTIFNDDGTRVGEDILLTNVEAFDVEVFDDELGEFADLGHSQTSGIYQFSDRDTDTDSRNYGPRSSTNNRIYDTMHPSIVGGVPAPYRPLVDTSGTTWAAGASVTAGDVVFAEVPGTSNVIDSIAFRAISGGTTGPKKPEWTLIPGIRITDGGVTWEAIDNRVGLKMIRITVRYRDTGTNLPRQVTLIHSFVE